MGPKAKQDPESVVREIKRNTRRKFDSEEKIWIILEDHFGDVVFAFNDSSIMSIIRHGSLRVYFPRLSTLSLIRMRRISSSSTLNRNKKSRFTSVFNTFLRISISSSFVIDPLSNIKNDLPYILLKDI